MDQSGSHLEPTTAPLTPLSSGFPVSRLQVWAQRAANLTPVDHVPAQREHRAA